MLQLRVPTYIEGIPNNIQNYYETPKVSPVLETLSNEMKLYTYYNNIKFEKLIILFLFVYKICFFEDTILVTKHV